MKHKVRDLNDPSRWNMRIWDDDKKEWLCQSDDDALTYYGFDITGGETTEFQGLPKWHPDRRLIWEQSTGLHDKNGKEIYEGDIVKVEDAIFTIGWNSKRARFGFEPIKGCDISMKFSMKECVVIGNIHERKLKYKIQACVHHEVVDEFKTDSLEEAREWWRKNWKKTEENGDAFCEWYVDGVYQNISQKMELEEG